MLKRCLPFVVPVVLAATPASAAGVIKCKVEGEKIVFNIDDHGASADVSIGTLSSAPKLIFKGVPIKTQDDQSIVVEASPEQQVGTTDKLKCAVLQQHFHLLLTPRAPAGTFSGELSMLPYYKPGSDRTGSCRGFAAPEVQDQSYANVICKR